MRAAEGAAEGALPEEPAWLVDWFQYQSLPEVKPAMARALLREVADPGERIRQARLREVADPGERIPQARLDEVADPGERIRQALRARPESATAQRAARMRAEAALAFCAQEGIRVHLPLCAPWPAFAVLRDVPLQLFVEGTLPTAPLLSVAGTREPNPDGLQRTHTLIREAAGLEVGLVTGIARGVDSVAQDVANGLGMPSVAVRAGCLREPIGASRARTLRTLLDQGGAQISEGWPQQRSHPWAFVRRNRLVTALGVGLLLIQARAAGGTVQAAEAALRQGRPVALPEAALRSGQKSDAGLRALIAEQGPTLPLPGERPPLTLLGQGRPLRDWLSALLAAKESPGTPANSQVAREAPPSGALSAPP